MFSSEAVQEYVTYPEKKHNKIGTFATDATKECFFDIFSVRQETRFRLVYVI